MFGAIARALFGGNSSKAVAKSRLHFVLVQDRTGLGSEELSEFKEELVDVIERYFVIDKSGFDIAYKRDGETTTLFINSPIIVRRQDTPGKDVGAKRKNRRKDGLAGKVEHTDAKGGDGKHGEKQAEASSVKTLNAASLSDSAAARD